MKDLLNQVALVTGASSGIGRSIALALDREGAQVCLVGRLSSKLEAVRLKTHREEPRMIKYVTDLSKAGDINDLADQIIRNLGRLDILIHSAGVLSMGTIEEANISEFDSQYQVNLRAPFLLTHKLLPLLIESHGQVVFVNSSVVAKARAGVSQYAATKHGLRAIADSLREEVNEKGVRILSLFLGRTASPMQRTLHHLESKSYHPERLIQPEDVAQLAIACLRLPRTAEVTDVSIRPMQKPKIHS